jgi:plasmid replication initiation protein
MKKRDNLVVYKNEFNTVPLRNFNSVEMDLLMAIMSQMRDRGESRIAFSFDELKVLSKYNKETAIQSFIDDLKSTYNKLIQLNVSFEDSHKFVSFVFFTKYEIDKDNQEILIQVNEEFAPLINQMTGSFTKFELEQFTQLKSSYSKTMYRLLKQFRLTGFVKFSIDEFRKLLDIPESYAISDIDRRVLKPICNELSEFFENLTVKKIKKKRRVVALEFRFKHEDDLKKHGMKTFRDPDGLFYEKNIMEMDTEEVYKTFPVIKSDNNEN